MVGDARAVDTAPDDSGDCSENDTFGSAFTSAAEGPETTYTYYYDCSGAVAVPGMGDPRTERPPQTVVAKKICQFTMNVSVP